MKKSYVNGKKPKLSAKTVKQRLAKIYAKIETLNLEIAFIKARCSHDWEYESDPSGNNDSGYYCRACNSWRRRLPE